ncbi:MAG: sugar ABC transporter ATP-binding protein [Anaerolineae bacterium]|nr:sugar ABC transporter ATP-binding protein [Anaerolineae bacterium]
MANGEQILRVEAVHKHYGGVHALNNVQFDLKKGEVHALVGENGAGKSTLVKVLGGVVPRDSGKIFFEGQEVAFHRPIEAQQAGISIIHQELTVMPSLSVIENLFMGRMHGNFGWLLNWGELEQRARAALEIVRLDVDPHATVRDLTISQRQMIEIARAVSDNAKLIIMDEPNSSLSETETERLFEVINDLQEREIAIIYVSHKIEEVLRISQRITVFKDGQYVGTLQREEASEDRVINMMVGRELDRSSISIPQNVGSTLLEVRNLTSARFKDISFDVRAGEIVAFAGLVGAGRSETLRALFGADRYDSGEIIFDGKPVHFTSPQQAIRQGIAMVPEDRKVQSLFMGMKIMYNISLAQLPVLVRNNIIRGNVERGTAQDFVRKLDIRLASIDDPVSSLSGGNQQKTVLARWLATKPRLLILDEPTHGVDVGAKSEIYELMRQLAREGMGIILISSELPEIMVLAHRIVVMHEGRITGIVNREDATEELLMAYATGLADDKAPQNNRIAAR